MEQNIQNQLPEDLQLISASQVRSAWRIKDSVLRQLEGKGLLLPLRFGRRRYYALGDLRRFLDAAKQAAPMSVPWGKPTEETNTNTPNTLEGQIES